MAGVVWIVLWAGAAVLALIGVVRHRLRLRAHTRGRRSLDDQDVRRIIATGVFSSDEDEPTDLSRVQEAERRFWEEAEMEKPEWSETEEAELDEAEDG